MTQYKRSLYHFIIPSKPGVHIQNRLPSADLFCKFWLYIDASRNLVTKEAYLLLPAYLIPWLTIIIISNTTVMTYDANNSDINNQNN